jgi:hypothetical protein
MAIGSRYGTDHARSPFLRHGKSDTCRFQFRKVRISDLRIFLQWIMSFGEFNRSRRSAVNGRTVLRRRFRHVLPDTRTGVLNFSLGKVTYTTTPLTAAQIMNLLFQSSSVATIWRCLYHVDQVNYPVYELDFSNGTRLDSALVQIRSPRPDFQVRRPARNGTARLSEGGSTFPVDIANNYVSAHTNGQPATNDNAMALP